MIIGIPNRAPSRQRSILRLHEPRRKRRCAEQSGCNLIHQRLGVRPVVAGKKRSRIRWRAALKRIEGLCIRPSWIESALGWVRRKTKSGIHDRCQSSWEKVLKKWNGSDLTGVYSLLALLFERSCCRVPIDAALWIADVVEGHSVAPREQTARHPADVRDGESSSGSHLTFVR